MGAPTGSRTTRTRSEGKPEQRPAQKPASPQKQVTKKPALTLLQTDDGDYAAVAGFAVLGAAALAPGAARKRMR